MDFHLQSSKVQATLETSHGRGMRAEPHSKSLKVVTRNKRKTENVAGALGVQISLLFLYHMVTS